MSEKASIGAGFCKRATDRALLVALETGEERWIPRSVLHDDSEVYDEDHEGEVVVKLWWAEKEGLG